IAKLGEEVVTAEVPGTDAGAVEGEDRPLEVAGRGHGRRVGAEVGDGRATTADVERIPPRGLEPKHRPAGHLRARRRARPDPEAAVAVLGPSEPRRRRIGGAGAGGADADRAAGDDEGSEERSGPFPPPGELEPGAVSRDDP